MARTSRIGPVASDHDARLPCIVGTARRTWKPGGEPTPEPLAMWEDLSRQAATDVGVNRDVLAAVDHLALVHCQSWAYDDPVDRLAERIGLEHYTKRMTAFMDVDMAAANILVTKAVADAWSVPDEHRVYLRGWGFARDAVHITARTSLSSSAGMRTATSEALGVSGFHIDEIDIFDLSSCFGSAVQFARDALGVAPDDPRPISMTGGCRITVVRAATTSVTRSATSSTTSVRTRIRRE